MSDTSALDDIMARLVGKYHFNHPTGPRIRLFLSEYRQGASIARAAELAGVKEATVYKWKDRYPLFDEELSRQIAINRRARAVAAEARRELSGGVVLEERNREDQPDFASFRWDYFGRPTLSHQEAIVKALEDRSNLYVFVFGPTGMGKDTIAGDYVAWEVAPDTQGKRVAWFMESEDFSKRRLDRLSRYLTDSKVYDHAPGKTPGGQVPTRSLIDDYGPFRWEKGMVHPDGAKVERTQWDRLVKYFVRVQAPEQDPNLWATGVGGATYGSRIDICVCSDIFTKENQKSPTVRRDQYSWLDGTLDTRLDENGRLVVIGTMLEVENNYERLVEAFTASSRVVSQETIGPAVYTKYSRGVAVVMVKAILVDPETGQERSYWPERFPLDTSYITEEGAFPEKDLSIEQIQGMVEEGVELERGLRDKRERSPAMFKARFQQERDEESGGDFTEATLDRAKDTSRSFGRVRPRELIVVGVDPARRYGAGWVALAVDRVEQVVTVADFFWGENLGITGIKQKLVMRPIEDWRPIWFCYETNREAAVMEDPLIMEALKESGVSYEPIYTGASNRRSRMVSEVGSIAAYMRGGQYRVPFATAEDRARAEILFSHFKAWDGSEDRTRAGSAGHDPDDLAMANRAAWDKCLDLLEGKSWGSRNQSLGIPEHIRRKFDRMAKRAQAAKEEKKVGRGFSAEDVVGAFVGDEEEWR